MRTPCKNRQCSGHLPAICILQYCTVGKFSQYSSGFLHVFHFWLTHRSALVSSTADVQNQILNTLFLLQVRSAMPHQMQDAIGFSLRLCSIIFPLYDNRILCFFQCIGWIFCCFLHKWVWKNTSQIKCFLHWIIHQNGISCRTGTEFWDHIRNYMLGFGSADRNVVRMITSMNSS